MTCDICCEGHTPPWVLWAEGLSGSGHAAAATDTLSYRSVCRAGTNEEPAFSAEVCFVEGAWLSAGGSWEMDDSLPGCQGPQQSGR